MSFKVILVLVIITLMILWRLIPYIDIYSKKIQRDTDRIKRLLSSGKDSDLLETINFILKNSKYAREEIKLHFNPEEVKILEDKLNKSLYDLKDQFIDREYELTEVINFFKYQCGLYGQDFGRNTIEFVLSVKRGMYRETIFNYVNSPSGFTFATIESAVMSAITDKNHDPSLLEPLFVIYRNAFEKTYWEKDYTSEAWNNIEKFERPGAKGQFIEQSRLKQLSLDAIQKIARLDESKIVIGKIHAGMQAGINSFNVMVDDSARQIAAWHSYEECLALINKISGK